MDLNQRKLSLKARQIHFIGIGGIGMSALARHFHAHGCSISGSDKEHSDLILELQKEGIKNIWTPHNKKNLEKLNPDYIIFSTAINTANEEIIWSKENKKQLLRRSELLEIAIGSKKLIAISGTHGKTTTTAMVTEMLINNNMDPSAILGGIFASKNTNSIIGRGDYFVIEADESDKSFLVGNPDIAVITNIEQDHLENYPGGFEEIKKSFLEFGRKAISKTGLVACLEDKVTKEIITKYFNLQDSKLITYSINAKDKPSTINSIYNPGKNAWEIYIKENFMFSFQPNYPGKHNVLNALACTGVGYLTGISPVIIKKTLENHKGVKRRFEILKAHDITIIDDYAHHPTEISATIIAAKAMNPKRLVTVLQPHQALRLRDLWKEFKEVLCQESDPIYITETYIARGIPIEGVNSESLAKEINKPNVNYIPGNIEQIVKFLEKALKPGDLILILGAGDITNLCPKLLESRKTLATKPGSN